MARPVRGDGAITGRTESDRSDLIQVVYVSEATSALDSAALAGLEATSRRKNDRARLTGFLLYQGLKFYGLLEGPQRALLSRMEAIATDPRHRHLRVLREEPVESRRFRNWSFAALPGPTEPYAASPVSEDFIKTLAKRL